MRRAAIFAVLLLAACKPSFDDRYHKAEKDIRTQASGVDSELAKQPPPSPQASDTRTPTPSASPQPSAR